MKICEGFNYDGKFNECQMRRNPGCNARKRNGGKRDTCYTKAEELFDVRKYETKSKNCLFCIKI